MRQLARLKKQLLSRNWDVSLAASDKLAAMGGDEVLNVLIPMLKSRRPSVRNSVALALREIGDSRAAASLMEAVRNPKNRHFNGTLVYALETHNCNHLFFTMVKLALYGDYEVQCHALIILSEQKFMTTPKEIERARQLIKKYRKRKNKCKGYTLLLSEVSRYVSRIEREMANTKHALNSRRST